MRRTLISIYLSFTTSSSKHAYHDRFERAHYLAHAHDERCVKSFACVTFHRALA